MPCAIERQTTGNERMATKRPVGFKFSEEAIILLQRLSAKLGISQAAVLEILIREKAKEEKVSAKT